MKDADSGDADWPYGDVSWVEIDSATGQLRCPRCEGTQDLDFHAVSDNDRYQKKVALAVTVRKDPAAFEKQQPVGVYCYMCEHECFVPPHCQLALRTKSAAPGPGSTA